MLFPVNSVFHIIHISWKCSRKFWGISLATAATMKFTEILRKFLRMMFQLFTFILSKSLSKIFCCRKKIRCCCRKVKKSSKHYLTSSDKVRSKKSEVSENMESNKIKQISYKIIDDCSFNDYSASSKMWSNKDFNAIGCNEKYWLFVLYVL